MFTIEEAQVAVHLSFTPKSIEDIAHKAGLSVEEVSTLCDEMADKGLVFSRVYDDRKAYMLLPLMPGIFEYPFAKRKHLDLDFDRLKQLWLQYYYSGDATLGHEFHGSQTSLLRVIPVRKAISATSTILPFEELSYYIDKAEYISVMDCACRIVEKKCNNPLEVCLTFDGLARYLIERKMAPAISQKEALKILEKCEEAGMVHQVSNTSDRIQIICNCCSCCCLGLAAGTKLKDIASRPMSNFQASINAEDCNACGICEDRCPVEAITVGDMAVVNVALCIGCGLCASACATAAVSLIRRPESIEPPAKPKDLSLRVAQEKGRLDAFLAALE